MNVTRYRPYVLSMENGSNGDRGSKTTTIANSQTLTVGSFFDPNTGTAGARAYIANQAVRGIVLDIETFYNGNYISVFDAPITPGTVTQPTATVPGKYATTASNVSQTNPDRVVYEPIHFNDEVEAFLTTGTAGALATRGTTAASNVLNNFIEPDANFPYMLLETSANAAATGLNFQIVGLGPTINQVVVKLINPTGINS
jgi:hypothetical protein